MKLTGKILILTALAAVVTALFGSCEKAFYKDELYRKEIYIVSGENNIFDQEFSFGGDVGYVSVYAGGTTGIEEDVTVELAMDYEAIGEFNKRYYDTDINSYLLQLPEYCYTMETTTVTLKADAERPYAVLPFVVNIDELLVDNKYAIPLRIESVSGYMVSPDKDYALVYIHMKNDYATTKSDTYYSMNGTSTEGIMNGNDFVSIRATQPINMSKLMMPVSNRSVRILPAGRSTEDNKQRRDWALVVTVDPVQTVDVPVLDLDGLPTDEYITMKRVSVAPYNVGQETVTVRTIPDKQSYYDPETRTFVLYYWYRISGEIYDDDKDKDEKWYREDRWYEVIETMYDTRL